MNIDSREALTTSLLAEVVYSNLPANAIGKDYRPITNPLGISSSGSGVQATLLGLLGVNVVGRAELG